MKSPSFRLLPFVIGAALIAGIVHLAIVLILPQISTSHASARLSLQAPDNALEVLQLVGTGKDALPLPFAAPSVVTAICRFDLTNGPVRLRIPVGDNFLSVTLFFLQRAMSSSRSQTGQQPTGCSIAFSKKFENHAHMVAIYAIRYNFLRIHKTLRVTPAMAADLSKTVLNWSDIVEAMDADFIPAKRGAYKKHAA